MNARLFSFIGGVTGAWRVVSMSTIVGAPVPDVTRLDITAATVPEPSDGAEWVLRGLTSSERYVTRSEKDQFVARQPTLGRPHATRAALIPIRRRAFSRRQHSRGQIRTRPSIIIASDQPLTGSQTEIIINRFTTCSYSVLGFSIRLGIQI